jgi:proteasome accessory factor B
VHTVSRKSERLVNLTIALLATKRYLTKAEIFKNVAGYSGDAEAKDRMFERDKDDLRSLGITIELGTFDPLFEDEAGYRIKPENYELQLKNLDATSIALLSHAGKMWREAALGRSAQSGLRKLRSVGINTDIESVIELTTSSQSVPEQLSDLIEAITSRQVTTFEYLNKDLISEVRKVHPYRLSNSLGFWYLIAWDIEKSGLRTFRLDRFNSAATSAGKSNSFEVDMTLLDSYDIEQIGESTTAVLLVRKGKSPALRNEGLVTDYDSEWDRVELQYQSPQQILREILWAGNNAIILEPEGLKSELITTVKEVISRHG